jgi:hypothetical protein
LQRGKNLSNITIVWLLDKVSLKTWLKKEVALIVAVVNQNMEGT